MRKTITVVTEAKTTVTNVTEQLQEMVGGVGSGLALFSVPHTTAALIICEDDAELREDLVRVAETWLAPLRPFKHIKNNNPNTEAHLLSAFAGTGVTVPVVKGRLELGTYQNILLLEMDGPKQRTIHCYVVGA